VPDAIDDLARAEAVLRNRAADALVRAIEAEQSQAIELPIRADFAANGFTPESWFDGLTIEGKVSYYLLAQMAAAHMTAPAGWSAWTMAQQVGWFNRHASEIACTNARSPWVCEHEDALLVVPELALMGSLSVLVPEAFMTIGGLLRTGGAVPLGFASRAEFEVFGNRLMRGLADAGYPNAEAAFQGSSVTGRSFHTGLPFDFQRVSDFDIALGGNDIFGAAKAAGAEMRSGGTRTEPLHEYLGHLGIVPLQADLQLLANRPVAFMAYRSIEDALARNLSMMVK
jgi:hypothetical protein